MNKVKEKVAFREYITYIWNIIFIYILQTSEMDIHRNLFLHKLTNIF